MRNIKQMKLRNKILSENKAAGGRTRGVGLLPLPQNKIIT